MKLFDFDKLINTLTGYIETRIELLKMDMREGMSKMLARLALVMVVALLVIFVLFFLFIGLSAWLNQILASQFLGYFITSAFFALILSLVLLSKERVVSEIHSRLEEDQKENNESDV